MAAYQPRSQPDDNKRNSSSSDESVGDVELPEKKEKHDSDEESVESGDHLQTSQVEVENPL